MRRLFFALATLAALGPGSAEAAPAKQALSVEREVVRDEEGYGCTTAMVTEHFPAPPTDTWPAAGDELHGRASVLAVHIDGRRVTWTVGPTSEVCASMSGDEWYWSTGRASFSAAYRSRFYVLKATRRDGVRSVAGLPTRWRGRQGPSLRQAVRAFGRPTNIQGSRWGRTSCHVRWARLGLRAVFANFAGRPACRSGWFQTARIAGPRAAAWAVVIRGNRDVATVGTSLRYLREAQLARYDYPSKRWGLSLDWLPYGTPGFYPVVSARLAQGDDWDGANPVRGFDLYIGAAGD